MIRPLRLIKKTWVAVLLLIPTSGSGKPYPETSNQLAHVGGNYAEVHLHVNNHTHKTLIKIWV